jgi:MFS family permease
LVAGVFADLVGRKRIVIFGYVMLGMGYAALGLFPYQVFSWYFYVAVDGLAWGIFALIFFITIWGELAAYRTKDKYYFLGVLPFLASTYVEFLFEPYAKIISVSTSFSLASLFLFLAVLPLMYAPETLPEKKIRERELKDYLKKAKETKEKYT